MSGGQIEFGCFLARTVAVGTAWGVRADDPTEPRKLPPLPIMDYRPYAGRLLKDAADVVACRLRLIQAHGRVQPHGGLTRATSGLHLPRSALAAPDPRPLHLFAHPIRLNWRGAANWKRAAGVGCEWRPTLGTLASPHMGARWCATRTCGEAANVTEPPPTHTRTSFYRSRQLASSHCALNAALPCRWPAKATRSGSVQMHTRQQGWARAHAPALLEGLPSGGPFSFCGRAAAISTSLVPPHVPRARMGGYVWRSCQRTR